MMWQSTDLRFQFDRPAERGLGPKSFGEGVLTAPEARESVVDSIRDAILAHYDPGAALAMLPNEPNPG